MNAKPDLSRNPTPLEAERWIEELWQEAEGITVEAEFATNRGQLFNMGSYNVRNCCYVRMTTSRGHTFYCYYDRAPATPSPLIVHTPGYNSEVSTHHMLKMEGFNVLHIDPLGYLTPSGPDESKKRDGGWPVLGDTMASFGREGYREWFLNCIVAVRWALGREENHPDRVSFFGTSQGGMGSLVLGSIFAGRGARCVCSDVPYLQNLGMGGYDPGFAAQADPDRAFRALAMFDGMTHRERLSTMPVLLTCGGKDEVCPPETISALYDVLTGTKSLTYLADTTHGYTQEFVYLAKAWLRMYA